MNETKCPTCGGKCTEKSFTDGTGGNYLYSQFKALPQPDLTKLREIVEEYETTWRTRLADRNFYQAVKEFIGEAEP